jgi:hypothetical protein
MMYTYESDRDDLDAQKAKPKDPYRRTNSVGAGMAVANAKTVSVNDLKRLQSTGRYQRVCLWSLEPAQR